VTDDRDSGSTGVARTSRRTCPDRRAATSDIMTIRTEAGGWAPKKFGSGSRGGSGSIARSMVGSRKGARSVARPGVDLDEIARIVISTDDTEQAELVRA
jgi:hypothetical protein